MRTGLKSLAALMLLALQGCSMAPTYTVPSIDLPAHYREQTSDGPWHSAQPSDQLAPEWWKLYNDPTLDNLQQQLLKANPDLAAALAHFDASQAYASQLHAAVGVQQQYRRFFLELRPRPVGQNSQPGGSR